ncbi:MAG: hypothetical protein LBJ14_01410 [Desulfarculales bacterium]|jgi:hypothetical protein|nr:hypothetical protein [Desulfarculales bacterium]
MRLKNIILLLLALSGCAGSGTQVMMGRDINLPAAGGSAVFLEVYNNSVAPLDNLRDLLAGRLRQQGYQVLETLDQAHYYVQLDVVEFGLSTEISQSPIIPGIGIGLGSWGGIGLGLGASLPGLFSRQSSRYTMYAYLRIEEMRNQAGTMHESSLVSLSESATFEEGVVSTRDAMLDRIMALFKSAD